MSKATLSSIMEQILDLAPEAVAMSQADGNVLISLNMTLDNDHDTLVPFVQEHELTGEDN
jgi:hypothetical protein